MPYDELSGMQHRLELDGRERLLVSGVEEVERFDEEEIVMNTTAGTLVVGGAGLHIGKLNLDGGELHVDGSIHTLLYEDTAPRGDKGKKTGETHQGSDTNFPKRGGRGEWATTRGTNSNTAISANTVQRRGKNLPSAQSMAATISPTYTAPDNALITIFFILRFRFGRTACPVR